MLRYIWARLVYTWGGLHRYFGIQNSMRSEFEHAVRYFDRALEIDPTFERVQLERGILLFRELNRPEEALADFTALLRSEKLRGKALFNRALVHQQYGRFRQAYQDLEQFLQNPDPTYQQDALRIRQHLKEILDA
jgi:tetratricopeptide (TPR) repeat protein